MITIELREQLLKEQMRLSQIAKMTKGDLPNAADGKLRIGKSQGCVQYYCCKPGGTRNGEYIPKENIEVARQLAQKAYNEKVYRYANKMENQLTHLLNEFEDKKIEKIYTSMHPERRKLILPVELTYEQELERWLSIDYEPKGFKEDAPAIMTNAGIRVRSKSEKIIADYLESLGIAYKYECPLKLSPYGIIYPDFTFLSKVTGKEMYWEHEGMMDNPEYARTAVQKIELYEKNDIFPGDRLILTFETSASVINTSLIKNMVNKYLV